MDRKSEAPLRDEAAHRRQWRGEESEQARPRGEGNTLPASEDDDERREAGADQGSAGPLATAPPPD